MNKISQFLGIGSASSTESTVWWRSPLVTRSALLFLLIVWAGYFSYSNLREQVMKDASQSSRECIDEVRVTLDMSNDFYLRQCHTAISTLRSRTLALGEPHQDGLVTVGGREAPNLYFGTVAMGTNFAVVDDIKTLMGATCTIFSRAGDDYVRITTNVQNSRGQRAIGTKLDPKGAAMASISAGKSFSGVVDILGNSFITQYDPIFDQQGSIIGVWYVGYPIETLKELMTRIDSMHILEHGFVTLLDNHNNIVAHSSGIAPKEIERIESDVEIMKSNKDATFHMQDASNPSQQWDELALDSGWRVHKSAYKPWGYTIIAATYVPDVFWRSLRVAWIGFLVMGLLALGALLAQGAALSRARDLKSRAESAQHAAEEASQTKSAFLANMSHELRTPLNAIIGYSEMIIEDASGEVEDIVPDLEKIRSSGKHLLALINDILDLSKIEAGKMTLYLEDFDVAHMLGDVASTIRPLLEKNGNTLEMTCNAADLGVMHGDLTKTRQVLFNLLSNASKFTKEGKVRIVAERVGTRFTFRISDTGIGMTPVQLGKLFKEFSQADESTTRKFGGTGLGLAICKRFCEMLGGSIEVTSTINVGSTFTVVLPVKIAAPKDTTGKTPATSADPTPAKLPTSAELTSTPGTRPIVLVIDDDPTVQDLMRRILEKEHFDVATASSGKQAFELCAKLKPCLITLDVMMPDQDGWSVLKKLKGDPATAEIPVIMVTMVNDKPLGMSLGAADYVTKPFDREQIIHILHRHGFKSTTPRVLVVDDDPEVYRITAKALEKDGIKTSYAPNGRTALSMVAEAKPDLIVLDLNMPEMNGIDFLAELHRRETTDPTPIVIFSAKDLTESETRLLRMSTKETLLKGTNSTLDLVDTVKRLLS